MEPVAAAGTGGSAGSGGAGGNRDGGTDLSADGTPDQSVDTPPGAGPTLDTCFAGLRAAQGDFQIVTKASANGTIRYRLAVETADRFGTSGTKPWGAFRFGIETPDGNVCVNQEAALATAYKGSRHNCSDSFEVTTGGRRYVIQGPDADATRASSTLNVFDGATMVLGPITLTTSACTGRSNPCKSGGPCN